MEKSQSNIILEDQKFSVVFNAQDKSSSSENPLSLSNSRSIFSSSIIFVLISDKKTLL